MMSLKRWSGLFVAFITGVVMTFVVASACPADELTCKPEPALTPQEQATALKINEYRAKAGLPPLTFKACPSAREWSNTMYCTRSFSHSRGNYFGEAIYQGKNEPAIAWYNSAPHRAIILSKSAGTAGIGIENGHATLRTYRSGGAVVETETISKDGVKSKEYVRTGRARPLKYAAWRLFK